MPEAINWVLKKRLQDALELFRLNVYLYPESANAFDSLGEIYTEPGNKKSAVEHYRQSLKLNPQKKMPDSRSKICNRPIFRYRIKPVSENWNKNRNVLYIVNLHRRNFRWFFYNLKYDLKQIIYTITALFFNSN